MLAGDWHAEHAGLSSIESWNALAEVMQETYRSAIDVADDAPVRSSLAIAGDGDEVSAADHLRSLLDAFPLADVLVGRHVPVLGATSSFLHQVTVELLELLGAVLPPGRRIDALPVRQTGRRFTLCRSCGCTFELERRRGRPWRHCEVCRQDTAAIKRQAKARERARIREESR